MTLPTIILINAGAAIALLVVLTATMRLPFSLPHLHRAGRSSRHATPSEATSAATAARAERKQPAAPADSGQGRRSERAPRRRWSELPDQA